MDFCFLCYLTNCSVTSRLIFLATWSTVSLPQPVSVTVDDFGPQAANATSSREHDSNLASAAVTALAPSYRQDAAKRQTACIVFTHKPKIRFFAPQGRLVAPILVKLRSIDGHLGPLGCAKFHVNRWGGVGMRPQKYQKCPLFGKESPRQKYQVSVSNFI